VIDKGCFFFWRACPPEVELCIYSCRFLCTILAEYCVSLIAENCVFLITVHTQAQLEQLKLKNVALETMISIAEKQFKIEIRKKSGTKPSSS
jgi:hypothetical protein